MGGIICSGRDTGKDREMIGTLEKLHQLSKFCTKRLNLKDEGDRYLPQCLNRHLLCQSRLYISSHFTKQCLKNVHFLESEKREVYAKWLKERSLFTVHTTRLDTSMTSKNAGLGQDKNINIEDARH